LNPPLVIAHATCKGSAPENTLAGVRAALASGVDGIEIDLHASADGVAMSGQPANACVSLNGAAYQCPDVTTNDDGVVTWAKRATTPYRIRLLVPATAGTIAVSSAAPPYQHQAAGTVTTTSKDGHAGTVE